MSGVFFQVGGSVGEKEKERDTEGNMPELERELCKAEVFDRKGLWTALSPNLGMRCKIGNLEISSS